MDLQAVPQLSADKVLVRWLQNKLLTDCSWSFLHYLWPDGAFRAVVGWKVADALRYSHRQARVMIVGSMGRDMAGLFVIAVPWGSGMGAPMAGMAAQALVEHQRLPLLG